jgi:hypothetical protein
MIFLKIRDLIISVDRFYESFLKKKDSRGVSLADLIVAAAAKYLMDFFDIPKDRVHIVTLDRGLRIGISRINDLPNAYDPTRKEDRAARIFL